MNSRRQPFWFAYHAAGTAHNTRCGAPLAGASTAHYGGCSGAGT